MRIAVTGPESSGKTTVSLQIAHRLNGIFIPEFARNYLTRLSKEYTFEDLEKIAEGQIQLWKNTEKLIPIVCDTEMIVLKIWSEYRYQKVSDFILKQLKSQSFDHYFLCSPDIPWEEDPLREHPEKRMELFELYLSELKENKFPFTILSGTITERISDALTIISGLNVTLMNPPTNEHNQL